MVNGVGYSDTLKYGNVRYTYLLYIFRLCGTMYERKLIVSVRWF